MFGKRIKLFKIFGFEVGIDWSWVILAILIAWSLSVGLFPFSYKNLSAGTYWIMGIVGAFGLFPSIVFRDGPFACHQKIWNAVTARPSAEAKKKSPQKADEVKTLKEKSEKKSLLEKIRPS
jgi:hypothetical protein